MTPNRSFSEAYTEDGYVFPVDVLSESQAAELLEELENAEESLAARQEERSLLKSYPDRLLPSFDQLIRNPVIIDAVTKVLGPDLMVWSASTFDKAPHSEHIVSWHQDLTYWGLDDAEEVTAWVALSPVTEASGCMYFVPGSHKEKQVPHQDTFAENNLLSRGQEIAVEVKEGEGVAVVLKPGQASLHHGHLFHSSGPNTTEKRRTGVAIRYIKPSMKQQGGEKSLVALVSGEDSYNHFKIAHPPASKLSEADLALCREDTIIKRKVLYAGAEDQPGTRY